MKKKSDRIQIPNCDSLEIYKQTRSKYYYVRFYVGLHHNKPNRLNQSFLLKKILQVSFYFPANQDDLSALLVKSVFI